MNLEVGKEVGVSRREGEQDWQPARVEQVDASIALGKCVGLVWEGEGAGLAASQGRASGCQHCSR